MNPTHLRMVLCPHCGCEIHFTRPTLPGASAGICEKCLSVLHYAGPIWATKLTPVSCPVQLINVFSRLEQQAKALARQRNGQRIVL